MVIKRVKRILHKVVTPNGVRWEPIIVGKKASIIKLCQEGRLHPRKCRKYG